MTTHDNSSGGEQPVQKRKSTKKQGGIVAQVAGAFSEMVDDIQETAALLSERKRQRRKPNPAPKEASKEADAVDEARLAKDPRAVAADRLNKSIKETMVVAREVIDNNLREARDAADRFRQGQYRASEIPDDTKEMAAELIRLARRVSETVLDLCDELVAKSPPKTTPGERYPIPAFRSAAANPIRVTLQFVGGEAKAHTATLTRPRGPTIPADIDVKDFAPLAGRGKAIAGAKVHPDLSADDGSLVVTVTMPAKPAAGLYSAMVFAKGERVPLGLLTIEVVK